MNLTTLANSIYQTTDLDFVASVKLMIDTMLIQPARAEPAQPPQPRDYNTATFGNLASPGATPPGGWISDNELRSASQRMNEAIAAEKWTEGFVAAMQLLLLFR
jgi:hypothetical protein